MSSPMNAAIDNITETMTLIDLLENSAKSHPQNVALQEWREEALRDSTTFDGLFKWVQKWAQELKNIGFEEGMRVALIEDNSIRWLAAFFAVLYAKGTVILIDPKLSFADYLNLIELADPQLVLVGTSYTPLFLDSKCPVQLPLASINGNILEFVPNRPIASRKEDGDSTVAAIIYTSGTTGKFKGVMLSHTAFLYSIKGGMQATGAGLGNVLSLLPFTHVYGLYTIFCPLALGCTVTIISQLQGEQIKKALNAAQVKTMPVVPRLIALFAARIENEIDKKGPRLSKTLKKLISILYGLRAKANINLGRFIFASVHKQFGGDLTFITGGAINEAETYRLMTGLGFTVLDGYGLTETCGGCCVQRYDDPPAVGTPGAPPPWTSVKIFRTNDRTGEGEILIKGPSVMKGYFRDPEATREVIKDDWFHTGDLGYLDEKGFLHITGRLKEVIVSASGQKAMPTDVERRYQGIEGIQEIAVFGATIAHSIAEEIHAAIVLNEDFAKQIASGKEITQSIEKMITERGESVPPHLRITQIHVMPALPKTSTLKVKRMELKKIFSGAGQEGAKLQLLDAEEKNINQIKLDTPVAENKEVYFQVVAMIQKVLKLSNKKMDKELTPSTNFQFDLQFDSLISLELIFALEEAFNVKLTLDLNQIHTIADLTNAVENILKKKQAPSEAVKRNAIKTEATTVAEASAETYVSDPEILSKLINITSNIANVVKKSPKQPISEKTNFQLDLGFDSLAGLELVFAVEEAFKTRLSGDLNKIHTIEELAKAVDLSLHSEKRTKKVAAPVERTPREVLQTAMSQREPFVSRPNLATSLGKQCVAGLLKMSYQSLFTLEVVGKEYLPREPFVLCANHCSHLDFPSLLMASGLSSEAFVALAAKDYFFDESTLRGYFSSLFNLVPFDRSLNRESMIDNLLICKYIKEANKNIILFPEGTRSMTGELQPFKSFIGILAAASDMPIIPTYISGTHDLLPKGALFPKRGNIKVTFGPPVAISNIMREESASGEVHLYQKITLEIYNKVLQLRHLPIKLRQEGGKGF